MHIRYRIDLVCILNLAVTILFVTSTQSCTLCFALLLNSKYAFHLHLLAISTLFRPCFVYGIANLCIRVIGASFVDHRADSKSYPFS